APALGGIYKLVEIEERRVGRHVMKRSEGKSTWPGRKQVWRISAGGVAEHDVIALEDEPAPFASPDRPLAHGRPADAAPLLQPGMRQGARASAATSLEASRHHCRTMTDGLPPSLLALETASEYPIQLSGALVAAMR